MKTTSCCVVVSAHENLVTTTSCAFALVNRCQYDTIVIDSTIITEEILIICGLNRRGLIAEEQIIVKLHRLLILIPVLLALLLLLLLLWGKLSWK